MPSICSLDAGFRIRTMDASPHFAKLMNFKPITYFVNRSCSLSQPSPNVGAGLETCPLGCSRSLSRSRLRFLWCELTYIAAKAKLSQSATKLSRPSSPQVSQTNPTITKHKV